MRHIAKLQPARARGRRLISLVQPAHGYSFVTVKWPLLNGPVQLFVPEYVPEIIVLVTPVAAPLTIALHPGNPDMPPVGAVIVNVKVVPESVPARLPLNATAPGCVVATTEPETELPDCDTVHVMFPGPVESEPAPAYVPLSVTLGVVGDAGVEPHEHQTVPSSPKLRTTAVRFISTT
jgi:hypothetical protein